MSWSILDVVSGLLGIAGRWESNNTLPAPSHESSCQLAFGGRRANNRQLLLWELPCTEDSDRKTSHPFRVISDTRVNTQEGEREACLIVEHENNLSSSKVTFE